VNPHRLQSLVATVPESIAPEQRGRLAAHVEATDSCRVRIVEVRQALRGALDGRGGSALDLAVQLDSLERVQERLDRYLTALVEELSHAPREMSYDDGVPV
jgi:site-specific recombinase